MPGKVPKPHKPGDEEEFSEEAIAGLAAQAAKNPFAHFPMGETRALFNFGRDAMRQIVALHPPMVKGKFNPDHFKRWLWEHAEEVEKVLGK